MLRIISGKHRGRRIEVLKDKEIRPTSGRAREALFNILSHGVFGSPDASPIIGKRVADVYCGSGAFGFEALSRGAGFVVFIDQNGESLALVRRNAESFRETGNTAFVRTNATQLPRAQAPCQLVFLDPPYGKQLVLPTLLSLAAQGWLEPGSVIVIEHEDKEKMEPLPDGYALFDTRHYGRAVMSLLRWQASE